MSTLIHIWGCGFLLCWGVNVGRAKNKTTESFAQRHFWYLFTSLLWPVSFLLRVVHVTWEIAHGR